MNQGHLQKKKEVTKKKNILQEEMINIPKKINILMINIHPLPREEEIQEKDLIHQEGEVIQDIEEGTQEKDIKEEEMMKDITKEDIKHIFHFVKSNSMDFFFLNSFFTDLLVDSKKFNFLFFLYLDIRLMTFQILFLHLIKIIKEMQEREKRINKNTPNTETRNICSQVLLMGVSYKFIRI
jgi:hypothetical protein